MKYLLTILSTLGAITGAYGVTYPIVDTGQTKAYGTDAGQDAHYLANAPSYRDHGDGTVTDQVTGLMWTKDPGEKMTLAEAEKKAAQCRVGGYSDWRLPSIKELYSLIQLNGTDPDPMSSDTSRLKPFIDDSVFEFQYGNPAEGERIIDSQFATCTRYVSTTMDGNETMFGVNFADGRIKGYPIKTQRGEGRYYVLYVRGNPDYGKNKFRDNGDGTITDEATGLTWIKEDSGKGMDWPTALEYAERMEFAGHDDWRLPNAKELQSIIDYTRSPDTTGSAAIDPVFNCTPITNEGGEKDFAQYWTSSTHIGARSTDTAVYFAFGRSLGWMTNPRSSEKKLMDVHGAGSQRSDPKTGDASRFPYGRGPQGDVIRIDNMVRLVRGGEIEPVSAKVEPEGFLSTQRPGQPADSGTPERQNQRGPSADRMLSRFDSNNDGVISKTEFKGPEQHFKLLDRDHDGKITRQEIESAPPPPRRRGAQSEKGAPRPFDLAAEKTVKVSPPDSGTDTPRPNIVFIYADDMGWTGTSVEMIEGRADTRSDFYQTPNLEKMAARGMVFSQAYSPGSMCTPSRAGILTGKTPAELHITTPGGGRTDPSRKLLIPKPTTTLPENIPTIGTLLKTGGYATALLGKWHIGRDDHAGNHGFDFHDGPTENRSDGSDDNPKEIFSLTERGIRFMEQCVEKEQPFYLQLSHYAVHGPTQCRPASSGKFDAMAPGNTHRQADYAGMTWDLDASLALIFKALERLGIADQTYIVFMSDNGAAGNPRVPNNAPLSAGKGSLYEGGIRIPLIITGPDVVNGHCAEPVSGTDLFATVAAWAGISAPSDESEDLNPLLQHRLESFSRKHPLFFHCPHYGQGPGQKPQTALISGNYKLLKDWESVSYRLFDLSDDPGEQHDLSASHPDQLRKMVLLMEQRLKETSAQLPVQNPDYDAVSRVEPRRRRTDRMNRPFDRND